MTRSELHPGDILLKMATSSFTHWLIKTGQKLAGQPNAFLGHAAIVLDTKFVIEAQKAGVSKNHVAKHPECGYYVFRPRDAELGQAAATAAELLFDVHQVDNRTLKYDALGAAGSVLGGPGTAKSGSEMDALLDRMLANKNQPFFCSQFVVYVYHWAASQRGRSPEEVFMGSDSKASPSALASWLVGNPYFDEVGYLMPNEY